MSAKPSLPVWTALIALGAVCAIGAHYLGATWVHWIAKPLTTLLVVGMVLSLATNEPGYRQRIVVGLLLSTLGDVLLMLPGNYFLHGLVSFLFAHLAYLAAFSQRARLLARLAPFAIYAVLAVVVLSTLWSGIPAPMRIPVVLYVAALGSMAAQAAVIWRVRGDRASALAAIGGALFMVSDSLIAFNRFGEPFDAARWLILASYWMAQWLIGWSVARAR